MHSAQAGSLYLSAESVIWATRTCDLFKRTTFKVFLNGIQAVQVGACTVHRQVACFISQLSPSHWVRPGPLDLFSEQDFRSTYVEHKSKLILVFSSFGALLAISCLAQTAFICEKEKDFFNLCFKQLNVMLYIR